jgi:hypothetical protein
MKRLASFLLVTVILGAPGRALALRTQTAYNITLPDGPIDAADAGIAVFELDDIAGASCRYYMEWVGPTSDQQTISLDCWLDELTTHGSEGCFADSVRAFPTVLVKDPRLPCTGFAVGAQIAPVLALVLGESSTGTLEGVVQFTPSTSLFDPIEATPPP